MSTSLTVTGISYDFPQTSDQNWGDNVTNWATAVTAGMLQKAGGSFVLTADVDFGANFGLKSLYYKSRTANIAAAGQIRLANADTIKFRNSGNSADLAFTAGSADAIPSWGGVDLVSISATQTLTNKTITAPTITGVSLFPSGSAGAPSIAATAATTTGIYFTATPQFGIAVGGSSIMEMVTSQTIFRNNILDIRTSNSGAENGIVIRNQSNTASSAACIESWVQGTSAGNPFFRTTVNGGSQWAFGLDLGNSSRFSIAQNSSLGSSDFLTISTAGIVTLGASGSTQAHVVNGKSLSLTGPSSGSDAISINLSQNSTSAGAVGISLSGLSGASTDQQIVYTEGSGEAWVHGLDKSDSHAFALSRGASLGVNNVLKFSQVGTAAILADTNTSALLNVGESNLLTSTTQINLRLGGFIAVSSATVAAHGISNSVGTANSAFTCALLTHFRSVGVAKGAASTVTRAVGYLVSTAMTTVGATNSAEFADNTSFTSDWFINSTSTKPSQLNGSLVLGTGALATNATDGFLYLPTCAGTPSGTPTTRTGTTAFVYDTTNNKLYVYNGAWKATAALT